MTTVRTSSGDQQMLVINESDLYSLTLTSRKPVAKQFKRWVTNEVLPTIRKTGSYGLQAPAIPQNLPAALRLAADQAEQIKQQQARLAITGPKADALGRIATANGSLTIREAAKDLQLKPLTLSNWLREHRWIPKQGKVTLAFQAHMDAGLMEHKVTPLEVNGKDGVMFETRHDNMLRLIRSRLLDADEWGLLNFKETPYADAQAKVQPMFEMTRDGSAFIVGKPSGKAGRATPDCLHRSLQRHGRLHHEPALRPALLLHGKRTRSQGQHAAQQPSRPRPGAFRLNRKPARFFVNINRPADSYQSSHGTSFARGKTRQREQ